MVLVRRGPRSAARGPPGRRGAQRRKRSGRSLADVRLRDGLPHGVRDPPYQPDGWAAGRESGLARLRPPEAAGLGVLTAYCHRDRGAARIPLAFAPLLLGAGRLAGVRTGEWPCGDDGGDVLLQLALQPYRWQRATRHPGARPRGKHPVRDRMDRYGGLVGGRDRVDRLRPEGLERSRPRTGDY